MAKNNAGIVVDCSKCELNSLKHKNGEKDCFECKVEEFKMVALNAKNEKRYNASVGRFYYSMYIRLVNIQKLCEKNRKSDYLVAKMKTNENGTHEFTIASLINFFISSKKITNEDKKKIQFNLKEIRDCKELRRVADYELKKRVRKIDTTNAERIMKEFEKIYAIMEGAI